MFTNKELRQLIIPLMLEQLLSVTIGMMDTMMVSVVGEDAVSSIALVDTLNVFLIQVFAALSAGGAVVAAQYLGRGEPKNACKAAGQLLTTSLTLSVFVMAGCLAFNSQILVGLFGQSEPAVMQGACDYFAISAVSFPFLALYSAGAALFRASGNSKISMFTALVMNVVNAVANAITIYGFQMGVSGAAVGSLLSRVAGAVFLLVMLHRHENRIHIDSYRHLKPEWKTVKTILSIGVPGGVENGLFQLGKILVQGMIVALGTSAIAANAIANNIAMIQTLPGSAVGLAAITVIGQCIGAGDYEQAVYYGKKLLKYAYAVMSIVTVATLILAVPLVSVYNVPKNTSDLALSIILMHGLCAMAIWAPSFMLPNVLRAAGDAKFTMVCSIISMWICRIGLSYLFNGALGMGLIGIWVAMICDWVVRAAIFLFRFHGSKWKSHVVV